MRHIKIFEEYSDEDLEDLMGDLEGIGHKHQLHFGKDFGFGPTMRVELPTGKSTLYFTPEAASFLVSAGYLESDAEKFGIFSYLIRKSSLPEMRGKWGKDVPINAGLIRHEKFNPSSLLYLSLHRGTMDFPESYYGSKFRRPTLINALNKILEEIKSIRK